jgi:hypothetical protein
MTTAVFVETIGHVDCDVSYHGLPLRIAGRIYSPQL